MTAPIFVETSAELSLDEHALLLSAINLSSQEKAVTAELKNVKVKVTELFTKRFDTAKTGTIAKLGESSIQVKRKAGKKEFTKDILELAGKLQEAKIQLNFKNQAEISKLADRIMGLQTSEEIEFMEFDLKQRVAALPEPEATYEVAIKV
jgi:hypothetical protein